MIANLVNRIDGKWHWELEPVGEAEINFVLAVSTKPLKAKTLGALIIVEVDPR